jgi:hypothetical protein
MAFEIEDGVVSPMALESRRPSLAPVQEKVPLLEESGPLDLDEDVRAPELGTLRAWRSSFLSFVTEG